MPNTLSIDEDLRTEIAKRLIERLDWIKVQPNTVLDLGCHHGQVTQALCQRYPKAQWLSTDSHLSPAQQAKKWGRWLKRPLGVCSAYNQLALRDQSVDLVLSNLVLQDADWLLAFKECCRVLKPQGLLSFTVLGVDSFKEIRSPEHQFPDMHDIGDGLLQVGFRDPVMDMETLTVTYEQGTKVVTYEIIYGHAWVPNIVTQGKPEKYMPLHRT